MLETWAGKPLDLCRVESSCATIGGVQSALSRDFFYHVNKSPADCRSSMTESINYL